AIAGRPDVRGPLDQSLDLGDGEPGRGVAHPGTRLLVHAVLSSSGWAIARRSPAGDLRRRRAHLARRHGIAPGEGALPGDAPPARALERAVDRRHDGGPAR